MFVVIEYEACEVQSVENIGAVIITYNIDEQIYVNIDSIINQVQEVLIIDNCSVNTTKEILKNISTNNKISIIYNNENYGIARALNQGLRYFVERNYDWVITLDHDSVASDHMISRMLSAYWNLPIRVRIITAVLVPNIWDKNIASYVCPISDSVIIVNNAIQSGSLYKCEMIKVNGWFNEKLFIYYVDDDYNLRINNNGFKILMICNVFLIHEDGHKTVNSFCGVKYIYSNHSKMAMYYITRNSIYMYKKYHKNVFIKRIIVESIKILITEPYKFANVIKGIYNGLKLSD